MSGDVRSRTPRVMALTPWLASCAPGIPTDLPPASTPTSDEASYRAVEAPLPTPPHEQDSASYTETLTLHHAIQRTVSYSPALKAARLEIGAKRSEAVQASLRPNPEVALAAEDVGPDDL